MIDDFIEIEFVDKEITPSITEEIKYMKLNTGETVFDLIEKGYDVLLLFMNEVGCAFTKELILQVYQKYKSLQQLKIYPIFIFFQGEELVKQFFTDKYKNFSYLNDTEGKYLKIFNIKEFYSCNKSLKELYSKGIDLKYYDHIFYKEETESSLIYSNEKVLYLINEKGVMNEYHCSNRAEVPDLTKFILEPEKIPLNFTKTLENLNRKRISYTHSENTSNSSINEITKISSPRSFPSSKNFQVENLFESPTTFSWFKLFMAYEDKLSYVLFLECIETFKKFEEEDIKTSSKLIIENFLKKGAFMDLEFDEKNRISIFKNLDENSCSQNMFDKILSDLIDGTIQFHFQRFLKSSLYQEMITKF